MAKATFGAGCFWGVEEEFRKVPGVLGDGRRLQRRHARRTRPTRTSAPTRTGHAEVVEVDYDPARVSYDTLLDVFWNGHNPTQLNRQGPDVGTQYRSAIFFHTPEQEAAARASKERLEKSGRFSPPDRHRDLARRSPSGAPRSTTSGTSRSAAAGPATSERPVACIGFACIGSAGPKRSPAARWRRRHRINQKETSHEEGPRPFPGGRYRRRRRGAAGQRAARPRGRRCRQPARRPSTSPRYKMALTDARRKLFAAGMSELYAAAARDLLGRLRRLREGEGRDHRRPHRPRSRSTRTTSRTLSDADITKIVNESANLQKKTTDLRDEVLRHPEPEARTRTRRAASPYIDDYTDDDRCA